jgi:hypothetical protein
MGVLPDGAAAAVAFIPELAIAAVMPTAYQPLRGAKQERANT